MFSKIMNSTIMSNYPYSKFNETSSASSSSSSSSINIYKPTFYEHPVRDTLYIVIPLTVIYFAIFLTGMLGNVITCVVISRNKSMHTATNYYLFSLAISDLLLLISGLPQEIYNMWYRYPYPFNEAICVLQGFAAETSANATVLTITAFTVERYVAICHPFLSHTMSKLSRAVKFVLGIWLIAMFLAVPQILDLGITHETCTVKRGMAEGVNKHVFTISTILVFVLPMAVISILYILIGLQLRRSAVVKRGTAYGSSVRIKHDKFLKSAHRPTVMVDQTHHLMANDNLLKFSPIDMTVALTGNNNHQTTTMSEHHLSNNIDDGRINYSKKAPQNLGTKHVVNMLVAVVVAFFICWAPHHAQRLFAIYGNSQNTDEDFNNIYYYLTYASGVLYFISTCINPFLYNIMSHKFREAFKDTLAKYLYHRGGIDIHQGRLTRNPSQRSNSNSYSANTCSSICTIPHQQLRYLETDLAYLKRSKRPLVVSFKRIPKEIRYINSNDLQKSAKPDCNHYDEMNVSNWPIGVKKSNDMRLKIFEKNRCNSIVSLNEKNISTPSCSNNIIYSSPYKQRPDNSRQHKLFHKSRDCLLCVENRKIFSSINLIPPVSSTLQDENRTKNVSLLNCLCQKSPQLGQNSRNEYNHRNSYRQHSVHNSQHKSPYESPEMSANCKQLEENLHQILENLILYPKNEHHSKSHHPNRSVQLSNRNQKKNFTKLQRSNSFPTLTQLLHDEFDEHVAIRSPHQFAYDIYNYKPNNNSQ